MSPRVSVVCATYNRGPALRDTVERMNLPLEHEHTD